MDCVVERQETPQLIIYSCKNWFLSIEKEPSNAEKAYIISRDEKIIWAGPALIKDDNSEVFSSLLASGFFTPEHVSTVQGLIQQCVTDSESI